jgi:hypothetical protein
MLNLNLALTSIGRIHIAQPLENVRNGSISRPVPTCPQSIAACEHSQLSLDPVVHLSSWLKLFQSTKLSLSMTSVVLLACLVFICLVFIWCLGYCSRTAQCLHKSSRAEISFIKNLPLGITRWINATVL